MENSELYDLIDLYQYPINDLNGKAGQRLIAETYDQVRQVLDGDLARVRQIKLEAGSFSLFRGHYSMHRVTAVQGGRTRIQAILGFSTNPDLHGSLESSILHYGPRVAHIEGRDH